MDMAITIDIAEDGTGQVLAEIIADPALTAALPPGADLLVVEDARQAGWVIEGPTPTEDGGLRVQMSKATSSMHDLAIAITEIGPPFSVRSMERRADTEGELISEIRTQIALSATLPNGATSEGFAQFSDTDLTSVLGGLPFQDQLVASGATPSNSLSLSLEITTPGRVIQHSGEDVTVESGRSTVRWQIPLDGSATDITLTAVQRPDGAAWADGLSTLLLVVLTLWVIGSAAFIVWVMIARRRRAIARRRRTSRQAEPPRLIAVDRDQP